MAELTQAQKERMANLNYLHAGAALVGSIGGVIYAKNTGGGFWRYIGYWILGGLVVGLPVAAAITPFKNKILKESDSNSKEEKQTGK